VPGSDEVLAVHQQAVATVLARVTGQAELAEELIYDPEMPSGYEALFVAVTEELTVVYHRYGLEALQASALRLARQRVGLS
jgi:hypothetical protein